MTVPPQTERDASGRFVKPAEPEKPVIHDNEAIHPLSKVLFGWVDSPRTPLILLILVIMIAVGLTLLDMAVDRKDYVEFAKADWFYSVWGFGAFAIAVLSGWPLGKLLRRDEDYYGEADTKPADTDPDMEP